MTTALENLPSINAAARVEEGLSVLAAARDFLDEKISRNGTSEDSAVLAMIKEAGATLEPALKALGVIESPGVVGDEADWLGFSRGTETEDATA